MLFYVINFLKKGLFENYLYHTIKDVTYHLLSLHSWAPQCSKGNIKAHSLRLTNEFCSEAKYLSDLTSTEINSTFKFPFSTSCPFLVISAIMLGCFGCFHRSFKWVALAGLLNLDLAVRLLSGLCPSSPQPQPIHSFSSMVLPSSIIKPVRVFRIKPYAARSGSHGFSLPGPGSRLLLVATSFSAFFFFFLISSFEFCILSLYELFHSLKIPVAHSWNFRPQNPSNHQVLQLYFYIPLDYISFYFQDTSSSYHNLTILTASQLYFQSLYLLSPNPFTLVLK